MTGYILTERDYWEDEMRAEAELNEGEPELDDGC